MKKKVKFRFVYAEKPIGDHILKMNISAVSDVSSGYESKQTKKSELSEEERNEVKELKKRDQEVRAHEAAHIAAGGSCVRGGASFTFQSGPDGKRYAVGGEVSIDTSGVSGDPRATIRKMQTVRKAALAPANPSGQDRSVASAASAVEVKAKQELAKQRKDENAQVETKKEVSTDPKEAKEKTVVSESTCCYASNGKKSPAVTPTNQINVYV